MRFKDPHYAGYYELKKQAGPKSRVLSACEEKILDILDKKGSMERKKLIGELLSDEVDNRTIISNSLRALVDDIYITVSRDENGAKIYHKI